MAKEFERRVCIGYAILRLDRRLQFYTRVPRSHSVLTFSMPLSKKRVKPRTFFDDAEDRFDGVFSALVLGFGFLGLEFFLHGDAPWGFRFRRRLGVRFGRPEVVAAFVVRA